MDLAETLLEAAGLPIPDRMQGRSLTPLLEGRAPADWRAAFYYHYYEFPVIIACVRTTGLLLTVTRWRIFTGQTSIIGNFRSAKRPG